MCGYHLHDYDHAQFPDIEENYLFFNNGVPHLLGLHIICIIILQHFK